MNGLQLIDNVTKRPALVKGLGDGLDPVWSVGEQRVLSVPIWAFAIGGLAYLLWKAKPGFGLGGWVKEQVSSWGD